MGRENSILNSPLNPNNEYFNQLEQQADAFKNEATKKAQEHVHYLEQELATSLGTMTDANEFQQYAVAAKKMAGATYFKGLAEHTQDLTLENYADYANTLDMLTTFAKKAPLAQEQGITLNSLALPKVYENNSIEGHVAAREQQQLLVENISKIQTYQAKNQNSA